ncbi:Mortality factor 4-like protein 2 [Saguinus oedipus]|uniref:Mortality factor 4-like protein 2 n=1 Tax=Saguinus oedipus TaxID=9490 RepID=A0ABQ9UVF6_SAGOE|nr:Mortality factor 4-like protein 2 [Saguinus oedipus]
MRKTRKNKQKTPGNGDGGSTSEAPQPPRKKKARADPTVESEEAFKNRMEVKVKIPKELKPWLVEDWDLLLYKFERPQYAEIVLAHPDAPMSQVYGAPHLLRLFVRIGATLAYTPLDEKSLALLLGYLHDFLKHLAKNSASLFTASDRKVASAENHCKAL